MIRNTPVPICKMADKVIWKFNSMGIFSITWDARANINSIIPHPKTKLINGLWNRILRPKL